MSQPQMTVTPSTALPDETLSIRLSGLPAGQNVTLRAQMGDWRSEATFQASASGEVDVARQKPVAGSYDVADAMGLIWSMTPPDMETVQLADLWGRSLDPMTITFSAEVEGEVVAQATIGRIAHAPGVTREVVRDEGLYGTLFIPPGDGPHPVVILVSGSGGGLNENRAALMASRGYAALALAYFNYEDLPKTLIEIPLEYFETAIRWLQNHPRIDSDKIVASGSSRGGELSLLLGATFPQIKAVVAYVPSGYVWGGLGNRENPQPAWTYRGEPVAWVQSASDDDYNAMYQEKMEKGEAIPIQRGFYISEEKATPEQLAAATIPVEKINGPVLLISGEDDQMWPSTYFSEQIMQRLKAHNFPHPYQHLHYPGAGHLVLTPHIPTTVSASRHPVVPAKFAYGGEPYGGAKANADSWSGMLKFLDEHL